MSVEEVLNITIGFSTTNKLISRLIRWVTRGKVSHAWIAFTDPCLGTRLVMQAEAWGFEIRTWERWKTQNLLIAEYRPLQNMTRPLRSIAKSLGVKYDWKSAFFAGLWRWFGVWLRGRFNSPKKLMCAEAVIRFLQFGEVVAVAHLDPEVTSPARLLKEVSTSTEFEKVEPEV